MFHSWEGREFKAQDSSRDKTSVLTSNNFFAPSLSAPLLLFLPQECEPCMKVNPKEVFRMCWEGRGGERMVCTELSLSRARSVGWDTKCHGVSHPHVVGMESRILGIKQTELLRERV